MLNTQTVTLGIEKVLLAVRKNVAMLKVNADAGKLVFLKPIVGPVTNRAGYPRAVRAMKKIWFLVSKLFRTTRKEIIKFSTLF